MKEHERLVRTRFAEQNGLQVVRKAVGPELSAKIARELRRQAKALVDGAEETEMDRVTRFANMYQLLEDLIALNNISTSVVIREQDRQIEKYGDYTGGVIVDGL